MDRSGSWHEAFNYLINSKRSLLFAIRAMLDALLPPKKGRGKNRHDLRSNIIYEARRYLDLLIRELDTLSTDGQSLQKRTMIKQIKDLLEEKKSSLTPRQKRELLAGINFCLKVIDDELKRYKPEREAKRIEIL